jgi:peptidoglycan/LPS O-acetylase OafA/YrhL
MVIFYHLNFELFSKGYLGVDIFFVISGYVISQRIYKDYLLYGKILIKDFFIRRLKRIFPVLIFIVIFVLFTFFIFGPSNLMINTYNTSFFTIFGVSNIYYLLQKKDYFDTVFNDPLGHTWSLGVEEQFYLIYPILIYGLFRVLKENREKKICLIFFIISILLILLTFRLSNNKPNLVFYFPLFRFWEFLAGCSLFFIKINNNKKNNLFSLLFFVLILTALLINMSVPYLYNNLIIVIFSSLLIYFYNKSALIDFIFENKFIIYIGNISYSLYLWHLPVIYFIDLYFGSIIKNILSLPVSIILSILTYHFIENKFRYFKPITNLSFTKKISFITFVPLLFFLYYIINEKTYENKIKLFIKNLIVNINYLENKLDFYNRTVFYKININGNEIYRFCSQNSRDFKLNSFNLRVECLKNKNQETLLYTGGNSKTAHFIPVLNNSNNVKNLYFEHKIGIFGEYDNEISFDKVNSQLNNFKNVIFATNISTLDELEYIKTNLIKFHNNIKILILGPIPHVDKKIIPLKCLIRQIDCYYLTNSDIKNRNLEEFYKKINSLVKINKKIFFYDPYKIICPENKCYVYNKTKDILTHIDNIHLTREGSRLLIKDFNRFYQNKLNLIF